MPRIDVLGTVIAHGSVEPAWAGTEKERQMDRFQLKVLALMRTDTDWGPRDAHGRRRQYTADQLDALAEFGSRQKRRR